MKQAYLPLNPFHSFGMNRSSPYWETFWPLTTVLDIHQACGYAPKPRGPSGDKLVFYGQTLCLQSPVNSSDTTSVPSDCYLTPQYWLEFSSHWLPRMPHPWVGLFLVLFEARGGSSTSNIPSEITRTWITSWNHLRSSAWAQEADAWIPRKKVSPPNGFPLSTEKSDYFVKNSGIHIMTPVILISHLLDLQPLATLEHPCSPKRSNSSHLQIFVPATKTPLVFKWILRLWEEDSSASILRRGGGGDSQENTGRIEGKEGNQ